MKGTVYFKKWSRMPWWSRVHHIRQLSHGDTGFDEHWHRYGHLIDSADQAFRDFERIVRKQILYWDDPLLRVSDFDKVKGDFVKTVLREIPEINLVAEENPFSELPHSSFHNADVLKRLLTRFFTFLHRGLSPKEATARAVRSFRAELEKRIREANGVREVAEAHNGVTLDGFFNTFKAREADLMTQRIKRDKALFDALKGKALVYDDDYEPNYDVVNESAYRATMASRALAKGEVASAERTAAERRELDEFIARSRRVMWRYYDQVAREDKLSGASNEEVMLLLFNTPAVLQRHFGPFVHELEKNGVALNSLGEPNFSGIKNQFLKRQLEKKAEMVRFALMLRDLSYGNIHHQNLTRRAQQLQRSIVQLNEVAAEKFKAINEEDLRELADKLKLSYSEVDDLVGFVYYEQHDREKVIVREPISTVELTPEGLLAGKHQRIDWNNDFRESIFERNLKLQADWLKQQIFVTKASSPLREELVRRLVDAIRGLRQVRHNIDRTALRKASRLFFLEHLGIDYGADPVDLDRLEDYLKVPAEVFARDPKEDHEYQRSKKAVHKTLLVADLEDPLRTGTHDPLEQRQVESEAWELLRHRPPKEARQSGEGSAGSLGVNVNYLNAVQMTQEEKKQYMKDNHISETGDDPMLGYLQSRYEAKLVKRAQEALEKKTGKKKRKAKA